MKRIRDWLFGQTARTTGTNSPAINMTGPGNLTVIFGEDAKTAEQHHRQTQQAIQDAADHVMAALRQNGVIPRAKAEGLAEHTVLSLAQRLRPDDVLDLDRAVREVEHAVEIALAAIRRGQRPLSNEDEFVRGVLAEVARQTSEGDLGRAALAVDDGLAKLDAREAELRGDRATLLEAGLSQDLLRRDAAAAARPPCQ